MMKTALGFLCVLGIFWSCDAQGQCSRVQIVRRSDWGASPAKKPVALPKNLEMLFIHHTASGPCTSLDACKKAVKNIQSYHQNTKKWNDIAYNFLVGGDGRAYEGRGWSVQGSHTANYNSKSVAITLIGNFETSAPSDKQIQAVQDLINCAETQGVVSKNYKLYGHKDKGSTACPGKNVYNIIKSWPHY